MRQGEIVLAAGSRLRPQELGLLAAIGRTSVRAHPAPRVAVMTTGDEVVEANEIPGPGQIRNGNSPMLVAQTARAGGVPTYLGIARDRLDSLRPLIAAGLAHDVLVLSGGVSAGIADLVPDALREAGVTAHLHKVAMKPGKPLFFGTRGATLVFGLPGNPVSSFVCFELFVRPGLARLRGLADPGPHFLNVPLAKDFVYKTDRATYHPAVLESAAVGWQVCVVPSFGSADLRGLTRANALVVLPVGDHHHRDGQPLSVLPLDA
jgi:molybdopterin molybdotransferase